NWRNRRSRYDHGGRCYQVDGIDGSIWCRGGEGHYWTKPGRRVNRVNPICKQPFLLIYLHPQKCPGEVSEWLKEHAWKVCIRETVSRVRIPLSPRAKVQGLGFSRGLIVSECLPSSTAEEQDWH